MKIENELFHIEYNAENFTVVFSGALRLNSLEEFNKIKQFLLDVYELDAPIFIIDFTNLAFLNSAGINIMCQFVFEIKDRKMKKVRIVGDGGILWQKKSIENLKRIWDNIEIGFV
ncbi:MAG: slr1659 superfamily regulator [Spirochaetota bacterium]